MKAICSSTEASDAVLHEIQYAAALSALRRLLSDGDIDLANGQAAAVALAETFGVLRRSI